MTRVRSDILMFGCAIVALGKGQFSKAGRSNAQRNLSSANYLTEAKVTHIRSLGILEAS
jgi:hypothetical protein